MYESAEGFVHSYVNQMLDLFCTGRRRSAVSEETPTSELLPCLFMQLFVDTGCRSRYVLSPCEDGLLFQSNTTGSQHCGDIIMEIVGGWCLILNLTVHVYYLVAADIDV